ncbi:MAG: fused MFS/spermidine synthase [Vicinamibacterales bacterium]
MIYLLFFLSGISGLVYQVVWVRVFGNVFGNTIYSASIVVAVFMLGLGVGSYLVGVWADRRYASHPDSLLRTYGHVEMAIAAMGLTIAALLPHLGAVSALVSSYVREPSGWYALSTTSYLARAGIAIVLLTPITLLMGGTLTLLIRHLVRSDLEIGGWRIALLYGINTAGAALGAVVTDFALVPAVGLWGTQMVAVCLNVVAGAGAWYLARGDTVRLKRDIAADRTVRLKPDTTTGKRVRQTPDTTTEKKRRKDAHQRGQQGVRSVRLPASAEGYGEARRSAQSARSRQPDRVQEHPNDGVVSGRLPASAEGYGEARRSAQSARSRQADQVPDHAPVNSTRAVVLTSVALAMSGLAALGMEILWFRHFNILLGGFRAVFSLLLTLILLGIGTGSLVGGAVVRRTGRPAEWLMVAQALFVASTLFGLASADVNAINSDPVGGSRNALDPLGESAPAVGALAELWFNTKPMLIEVAIPALLMGFSFPLANAVIQRAERSVGRRAGILYLANTAGAVCGSLAAGFVLLPVLGLQLSTTILMSVAALAVVPLYFAAQTPRRAFAGSLLIAGAALGLWLQLPSDYVTMRALGRTANDERRLVVSDGLTELIAVTDAPGKGRTLYTNGHAMSSTLPLSQRYMRALAHIPLLSMDNPDTVLVIGFGVGNTTHAATLHPSVRRVELADLSRDILTHAAYFEDANKGVLSDPKVVVHINDGRQHLQMQPAGSYDLIVLEPPPIAYAGVSALYSREFYALARTRLKPNGYISQWLPAYQVPSATALAMVRAFVDVFPPAVLLSGAESDLLLLGAHSDRIEIDPERVAAALSRSPAVRADLEQISLGAVHEIVGSFVGSLRTLAEATRGVTPVMDNRPLQEYGVRSMLSIGHGVPGSLVDLRGVGEWCPRCFSGGAPIPLLESLDAYVTLLTIAYGASPVEVARARRLWETERRVVAGSAYLGAIVPESAATHNALGLALAEKNQLDGAIQEFRTALELASDDAAAHWHLGAALASKGEYAEATAHLVRSVELDPRNSQAYNDLGMLLAFQGRFDEGVAHLERAIALDPQSDAARQNLERVRQLRRGTPP